jgi:hypothetical protein
MRMPIRDLVISVIGGIKMPRSRKCLEAAMPKHRVLVGTKKLSWSTRGIENI